MLMIYRHTPSKQKVDLKLQSRQLVARHTQLYTYLVEEYHDLLESLVATGMHEMDGEALVILEWKRDQ